MWTAKQPENANGWWVVCDEDGNELGSCDGGFEEDQAKMMAAAPELYESNEILLDVVQRLLKGKPIKCLDEHISFAQHAMKKAKADES